MSSVKPATELAWVERNQKEVSYALLITGVILLMGGLGAVALGSSLFDTPSDMRLPEDMWNIIRPARNIFPLLLSVGMVTAVIGGLCLIGGAGMLYDAHRSNKNKPEQVIKITKKEVEGMGSGKKWRGIVLVIGFAILMFGVGMLISSIGVLKSRALADAKTADYFAHWYDWNAYLKREWLDPFTNRLTLMATAGAITAIAGGGLMVVGGIGGHIREKWNSWFKSEEENLKDDNL